MFLFENLFDNINKGTEDVFCRDALQRNIKIPENDGLINLDEGRGTGTHCCLQ